VCTSVDEEGAGCDIGGSEENLKALDEEMSTLYDLRNFRFIVAKVFFLPMT
jgi:hypothetical protein